jgi:hypothetical protein
MHTYTYFILDATLARADPRSVLRAMCQCLFNKIRADALKEAVG